MTNRRFPVLDSGPPQTIPWAVAERAHRKYRVKFYENYPNHYAMTLQEFEHRGGFVASELDEWAPGWREEAT